MTSKIGIDVARNFTTADINEGRGSAVGDVYTDHVGKEYLFVKASSAISKFDAVWVKSTTEAVPLTITNAKTGGRFGVASEVAIAIDTFGWVQRSGACTISAKSACAPGLELYISGTAGQVDDATLSVVIRGVNIVSVEASSVCTAILDRVVFKLQEPTA